jgi:hypothetical protein
MSRAAKYLFYAAVGLLLIVGTAVLVQYQVRLRLVVGEPLIVGFSKGAWVECLSENELFGQIDQVSFGGVTVTDRSGTFTGTNMRTRVENGAQLCPTLRILVLNTERRQYFVPFSYIGGLRKNEKWFWSNPFPT